MFNEQGDFMLNSVTAKAVIDHALFLGQILLSYSSSTIRLIRSKSRLAKWTK